MDERSRGLVAQHAVCKRPCGMPHASKCRHWATAARHKLPDARSIRHVTSLQECRRCCLLHPLPFGHHIAGKRSPARSESHRRRTLLGKPACTEKSKATCAARHKMTAMHRTQHAVSDARGMRQARNKARVEPARHLRLHTRRATCPRHSCRSVDTVHWHRRLRPHRASHAQYAPTLRPPHQLHDNGEQLHDRSRCLRLHERECSVERAERAKLHCCQ